MSFSQENFTPTKKHKKQASDFHSDVFTHIYAQIANKKLLLRHFLYAQKA